MIVDGVNVDIVEKEIVDANILKVKAGTTGPMGGDSGHGCRVFFSIFNEASTDMRVSKFYDGFEVRMGGDSELRTIIEALEFILDTLKKK